MAPDTPHAGTPRLAGPGQCLDSSGQCEMSEVPWVRAAGSLTLELRSRGLGTRVDGAVGAVDAIADTPGRRVQQAVLRPHRGRLWWWLRRPGEDGLALSPLTPAADPAGAARRIDRLLSAA